MSVDRDKIGTHFFIKEIYGEEGFKDSYNFFAISCWTAYSQPFHFKRYGEKREY